LFLGVICEYGGVINKEKNLLTQSRGRAARDKRTQRNIKKKNGIQALQRKTLTTFPRKSVAGRVLAEKHRGTGGHKEISRKKWHTGITKKNTHHVPAKERRVTGSHTCTCGTLDCTPTCACVKVQAGQVPAGEQRGTSSRARAPAII
jgi:hypothetical protein